ncbi:hypothetical protein C0J52_18932 [Blattella germanica]|nr:hypothetical protein C0J52_18932 [Blattella germanica]
MLEKCDTVEMKVLIGLLITAGHLKSNLSNARTLWSKKYGAPIFQSTMSRQTFEDLLMFLQFDDKSSRSFPREKKREKTNPYVNN